MLGEVLVQSELGELEVATMARVLSEFQDGELVNPECLPKIEPSPKIEPFA